MVREQRLPFIQEKLAELGIEQLCHIPRDPRLEDLIYSGESVGALTDSPILPCIDTILKRIGG
jgi:hypothetical protein